MEPLSLLFFGSAVLLIAGTIKGFVGLGLPTVSLALLTLLIDPRAAISLILVPMFLSNFWQMLRGGPLWPIIRTYWRFAIVLAIMVSLTVWYSRDVSDRVLQFALGLIILLFAFFSWRKMVPEISPRYLRAVELSAALFAGIIGGLTAAWAAPMAMYLTARRVQPAEFVQASGFLITAGSLPLLVSYVAVGHAGGQTVLLSCLLVLPTLAGFSIGERIRQKLDPEAFRKALLLLFLIFGLNLVFRALA